MRSRMRSGQRKQKVETEMSNTVKQKDDDRKEGLKKEEFESVIFHENSHVKVFINTVPCDYSAHWHNPLEVLMPLENGYTVECEGIRRQLDRGEIALIAPGAVHALEAPEKGSRMFLQADLSCFSGIREIDLLFSVLPPLAVIGREHFEVREKAEKAMGRIREEYFSGYVFSQVEVYAELLRLLALAGESLAPSFEEKNGGENGHYKYKERFAGVCEYIRDHCTEQLTLEDTARVAGFSKYHFAHLFRQFTGMTFCRYLNHQRIMKAQRLLADPECTITEAALQCGYVSLSSFNRMFRQMKGCTPSQFRRIYDAHFGGTQLK